MTVASEKTSRFQHRLRIPLAGFFLVALFLPLLGTFLHWDRKSGENRPLANFPAVPKKYPDAAKYTDRASDWFRDHFGFRSALIHGIALLKYHGGLGFDTTSTAVVGKDRWLYFRSEGDRNFIASRGLNPFSEAELDEWQHVFEKRQHWLALRGIPYIVFFAPDKQTIYPEYLPDQYAPLPHGISRLDQIQQRLEKTSVKCIDLRPALFAGKAKQRLYHRSDTHWDDLGAYIAYREVFTEVQNVLPAWHLQPQPMDNFTLSMNPRTGDLGRILDLADEYHEPWIQLTPKEEFPFPPDLERLGGIAYTNMNQPNLPRLVMFLDSFGNVMVDMLGPNFSHACFSRTDYFDIRLIEKEKPDIVISELVERKLYTPRPMDKPAIPEN